MLLANFIFSLAYTGDRYQTYLLSINITLGKRVNNRISHEAKFLQMLQPADPVAYITLFLNKVVLHKCY